LGDHVWCEVLSLVSQHPWLHENHTSAPAPGDTDWNRHAGTCSSETSEWRQWAEAASDWNVVSNQQGFIDQAIDKWQACFNACLKAKSKRWTFAKMFLRNCMTFKAYVTAVTNKLTYVLFHKVGWEQPPGEVANLLQFCCKFTSVSVCLKLSKYNVVWQSYCKKSAPPTVYNSIIRMKKCCKIVLYIYMKLVSGILNNVKLFPRSHLSLSVQWNLWIHSLGVSTCFISATPIDVDSNILLYPDPLSSFQFRLKSNHLIRSW